MNIKYNEDGLAPAIAQDIGTGRVLMLAYMNEEAAELTLKTRLAHYYSRSRKKLWMKGETSGNIQEVQGFYWDCDRDAILLTVNQRGAACHTGHRSCFFNGVEGSRRGGNTLAELYEIISERQSRPCPGSYTNYLFTEGKDKILKKIGEETAEVILGAKNSREELIYESCDLLYHLLVLFVEERVALGDIYAELAERMPAGFRQRR